MNKLVSLLFLCLTSLGTLAQDALQSELFSADVIMKYQSEIALSSEQNVEIKRIYNDNIAQFNSTKWDLDAQKQALNTMLAESQVDRTTTLAQLEKVTQLEEQLKLIRLEMLIKIKNQLTAEQQTKLKELRTEQDMLPINLVTSISNEQRVKLQVSGSRTEGAKPLFVLINQFGEREVNTGAFESLDPDNIESVTVLKGDKATTKYGERGKNGVIVVVLKNR